jgi:hypothetical protein
MLILCRATVLVVQIAYRVAADDVSGVWKQIWTFRCELGRKMTCLENDFGFSLCNCPFEPPKPPGARPPIRTSLPLLWGARSIVEIRKSSTFHNAARRNCSSEAGSNAQVADTRGRCVPGTSKVLSRSARITVRQHTTATCSTRAKSQQSASTRRRYKQGHNHTDTSITHKSNNNDECSNYAYYYAHCNNDVGHGCDKHDFKR